MFILKEHGREAFLAFLRNLPVQGLFSGLALFGVQRIVSTTDVATLAILWPVDAALWFIFLFAAIANIRQFGSAILDRLSTLGAEREEINRKYKGFRRLVCTLKLAFTKEWAATFEIMIFMVVIYLSIIAVLIFGLLQLSMLAKLSGSH